MGDTLEILRQESIDCANDGSLAISHVLDQGIAEIEKLRARLEVAEAAAAAAVSKAQWQSTTNGELNQVRARIAELEAQIAQTIDWDWLEAEVSAIDTVYRGSPSYTRDAYWFRLEVLRLIGEARKADAAAPAPKAQEQVACLSDSSQSDTQPRLPVIGEEQAPQPAEVSDSGREAFESWAYNDTIHSANLDTTRNHLGDYADERTDGAWHGWQARAQLTEGAVPVAEVIELESGTLVAIPSGSCTPDQWVKGAKLYGCPALTAAGGRDELDAKRLGFLDRNLAKKMGWKVAQAPAGNISVQSVVQLGQTVTSIREAIDAAIAASQPAQDE